MNISVSLAQKLIQEQFPQFAHCAIRPIHPGGHDNRSFRLGQDMLLRLPSAEPYVLAVVKEQKWLSILAHSLSHTIPSPVAIGSPSQDYPWNWSIYRWIPGKSAAEVVLDPKHLELLAHDLARFLIEVHQIKATDGPTPGLHNYWRGGSLIIYDEQARDQIRQLKHVIDAGRALSLWERALSSQWMLMPVWVHGDMAAGNILIKENQLAAVIDFGCLGVGDPACDLAITWTLFHRKSREIFRKHVDMDRATWERARGWTLWKTTHQLISLAEKTCIMRSNYLRIIDDILDEEE